MNLLSLLLKLLCILDAVDLLPDFGRRLRLEGMVDNISTAKTFNNLDEAKFESRPEFMESNGNTRVLFLVLVIIRQDYLRARQVFNLTLRTVRSRVSRAHALVAKDIVSNVIKLSQVWSPLVVD